MRWNLGKKDDRWLLHKWQSVGTCTSIVRTAGSHQPTVLLRCTVICFSKVYAREGLFRRSHLSNHVFAHYSCGNPVGQHTSSTLSNTRADIWENSLFWGVGTQPSQMCCRPPAIIIGTWSDTTVIMVTKDIQWNAMWIHCNVEHLVFQLVTYLLFLKLQFLKHQPYFLCGNFLIYLRWSITYLGEMISVLNHLQKYQRLLKTPATSQCYLCVWELSKEWPTPLRNARLGRSFPLICTSFRHFFIYSHTLEIRLKVLHVGISQMKHCCPRDED